MPVFLADSIRSCPAAFSFSGNGLVVARKIEWKNLKEKDLTWEEFAVVGEFGISIRTLT